MITKVKRYLELLAQFEVNESSYKEILHSEFEQTEFPNTLNKSGQKSNYAEVFKRMAIGKTIISSQSFEVTSHLENEHLAYVEAFWKGELKNGQKMAAHFCMAFEFKGGLIYRQRNYDCFIPASPQ
jgi:hypothetical protein